MGLAVKRNELEVLDAVVKGASGLIKNDSADKVRGVEQLIAAGEKFIQAIVYLDKQYIKAKSREEEQSLWKLMEELVALVGDTLKIIDEYLADYRIKNKVSGEKLRLLEDLKTAYRYFAGEISLNVNNEELRELEKEAKDKGCIAWEEFVSELGLSE
jgi:hypothetical protein